VNEPVEAPQDGWTRYYVASSPLLQRELTVFADESSESPLFTVVARKDAAEVLDAAGSAVLHGLLKGLGSSKVEFTAPDGSAAGQLKVNSVLSKTYTEVALADGGQWTVNREGHAKQHYVVQQDEAAVARMDLTALVLKRHYTVDIADSVDLPLILGVVWAINFAHLRKGGAAGAVAAV
jgi:hypothetical protein